ncbi:MAG: iron ABC transporter permease [Desulfomonilia bacterium]|jgi:iron complex transport system permease protein|nr:iron ABC transporter permease [Deltaproteobacteria bacterium]MDX9762006.1 iron ABC transporter permease [Desulfomonilia bacterium]HPW69735.1 iron ABC transporter permease [Deltaproteobacteria bacterium]
MNIFLKIIAGNRDGKFARTGAITSAYLESLNRKLLLLALLLGATLLVAVFAVARGAYEIPIGCIFRALLGDADATAGVVIVNIRMPRVIAAILCGWGLSLSGLSIQSLLKNPLGSPSTLGISQGAAFGAAAAIVVFGAEMFSVTAFAFGGAMAATAIILILSGLKRLSAEAVILAGVALSSLFVSATILIQYLATETQLAMVVFWTFGDVARSSWREIGLMAGAVILASLYLMFIRWDLNVLASGEEAAKGLGVNVGRIRVAGMVMAALISAMATAFHGVIAFIGLIAPHMARRFVGDDHCLLIPFSSVLGALILLTADTIGRIIIGSGALPVGVITSFLGAPMFLYLLVRGYR